MGHLKYRNQLGAFALERISECLLDSGSLRPPLGPNLLTALTRSFRKYAYTLDIKEQFKLLPLKEPSA